MKRKSLLFLLLALIFMPWAANAQNRTVVTIGEGTSTQNFPLPGYWGYQYDVFLYTPTAAAALDMINFKILSKYHKASVGLASSSHPRHRCSPPHSLPAASQLLFPSFLKHNKLCIL